MKSRKIQLLDASHLQLFGPPMSGKSTLAHAALGPEAVVLNGRDLRFCEADLLALEPGSSALLIEPGELSAAAFAQLQRLGRCIVINSAKADLPGFCAQFVPYLDYEEFCAFSPSAEPAVGDYLLRGCRASAHLRKEGDFAYQQGLGAAIGAPALRVLATCAAAAGRKISVAALYAAHRWPCGKGEFYAAVDFLERCGLVFFLPDGRGRRLFLGDFALRNALCAQKNFAATFAGAVAHELRALHADLRCGEGLDFYSPAAGFGAVCDAFASEDFAMLRARKLAKTAHALGLREVAVLTLSASAAASVAGVKIATAALGNWLLCKDEPL